MVNDMDKPVLGTMNINYQYSSIETNNIYNQNQNTIDKYKTIIETYLQSVGKEYAILDSAYYYGNTTTEQILGEILPTLSFLPKITTKVNPWFQNDFTNGKLGQLSADGVERQLTESLTNLKLEQVDVLYLHCPDYETPIEITLETCDKLWRNERFNHFGISNFSLDQTKEIIDIIEKEGFQHIDYYEGMYNMISRKVEEIFPLLRENNIAFWAYNPLAGGLLTGKYKKYKNCNDITEKSRFKDNTIYQSIYWKSEIIENNIIQDFFQLNNNKCIEYSYLWLQQYSKMNQTTDKIILGCSNAEQLSSSLDIIIQNNNNIFLDNKTINQMNYLNTFLYNSIAEYTPNYWY
jgi:aflatoxin B1 aldehyde reductase